MRRRKSISTLLCASVLATIAALPQTSALAQGFPAHKLTLIVPFPAGGQHYLDTGEEWPHGAFESCQTADAILLGAVGLPNANLPNGDLAGIGVLFGLRFGLDLYANIRPTKLYPNVRHKVHDGFKQVWDPGKVDFVIIRENTEGLYTPTRGYLDRGGTKELAIDSRVITRKGAERVIRFAFELAKTRAGAPGDGGGERAGLSRLRYTM